MDEKQQARISDNKEKKHFLADLAGSLSKEEGADLAKVVNSEFQEIEGEW